MMLNKKDLLDDCRKLMTDRMRTVSTRIMDEAEDSIFSIACNEDESAKASKLFDTLREIRLKRGEFQIRFENRFTVLYEGYCKEQERQNATDELTGTAADQSLPINAHVENIRSECRASLSKLDEKMTALIIGPEAKFNYNPMQPEVVFNAFYETYSDFLINDEVHQLLMELFERHIGHELQAAYEDVNHYLYMHESGNIDSSMLGKKEEFSTDIEDEVIGDHVSLSRYRIMEELENHFVSSPPPAFVRYFLSKYWRQYLEAIHQERGYSSNEWKRGLSTVDDLLFCISQHEDKNIQQRQVWLLFSVIYRLKTGMKKVGMPVSEQIKFISELKTCHQEVVGINPVISVSVNASKSPVGK